MADKAALLAAALRESGGDWPAPIEHHAEIGSTNDRLRVMARDGAPEWSVVFADLQTAGRGRHGNEWRSGPGNLYLSVLLRPRIEAKWLGLVPLAAGLAVAKAARGFGADARLKWPNDVWVDERKLAGILVEAHSTTRGVEEMIVGCGVNVASAPQAPRRSTGAVAPIALSSARGGKRAADPVAVGASLLRRMQEALALLHRDPAALRAEWRLLSLPWWGRVVAVEAADGPLHGTLQDLDAGGGLILETDQGRSVTVVSGEVRAVRLG